MTGPLDHDEVLILSCNAFLHLTIYNDYNQSDGSILSGCTLSSYWWWLGMEVRHLVLMAHVSLNV